MSNYITLIEVQELVSQAAECSLKRLPQKKIMFRGKKHNGETVTLCSPQSKFHPQGFYWVDITEKQCRLLDETEKAIVVFRLEGRRILMVKWSELKSFLTPECMRYNKNEQNHWKLNIYDDYIKVSGNPIEFRSQSYTY